VAGGLALDCVMIRVCSPFLVGAGAIFCTGGILAIIGFAVGMFTKIFSPSGVLLSESGSRLDFNRKLFVQFTE